MTVCSCHVTYAFQGESTLYSCLNVKELLARSMREIWRLSDCNWTRTQNHLVRKRTLNHLAKWLSILVRTKWFWVRVQLQELHIFNIWPDWFPFIRRKRAVKSTFVNFSLTSYLMFKKAILILSILFSVSEEKSQFYKWP